MRQMYSEEQLRKLIEGYLASLPGYDPTKTQALKQVNGKLVWVAA